MERISRVNPADGAATRSVLVVDDEDGIRHMLAVLLARDGYQVTAVGSAEQALAEQNRRNFDVVLSDIRMPGADGLSLVDELRRRGSSSTLIVMSAFGSLDIAVEAVVGKLPPVRLVLGWAASDQVPFVLGQFNFFQAFDISFFRSRGIFEIRPASPSRTP